MVDALAQEYSARRARSFWHAVFALLTLMQLAVWSDQAKAQSVTLTKEVCDATTGICGANSVTLGQTLYYQITIDNIGGVAHQIDVKDTLPAGFIVTGAECGPVAGPMHVVTPVIASPLVTLPNEPLGPVKLICRIKGSFGAGSLANASDAADVIDHHSLASLAAMPAVLNHIVDLTGPLPSDLSLTKTADKTSLDISPGSSLPHHVTYKIRLKNLGANDLYLGSLLEIQDRLSLNLNGVALNVQLISATCAVVVGPLNGGLSPPSDCLDTTPVQPHSVTPLLVGYSAPHDFAAWRYPTSGPGSAGLLRVGDEVVLTVVVEVSAVANLHCVITPGGDGFDQEAHIVLTLPGSGGGPITTLADLNPLNNTATVPLQVITGETIVDPDCNAGYKPKLAIKKVQLLPPPSGLVPWHPSPTSGPPVVYQVTVTNVSSGANAATIKNINFADLIEDVIGTPPFTATVISPTCASPDCAPSVLPSSQQLPGYGLAAPIFTATLFGGSNSLAAGSSFSFNVYVRYSDQRCDSLRDGNADPIRNHARVSGWQETDNVTQVTTTVTLASPLDSYAQTNMVEAPACPLIVKKKAVTPGPIVFNAPYTYAVVYANPTNNPTPFIVGTLIDTLSIAPPNPSSDPPYAITLKVDYTYACTATGPIGGHPTGQTGIAYIVANALPQQGVRLIQNSGPVNFGPLSSLACAVTVTVRPPAANDPYCWTGSLVNSAILDMSAYYNPNLPWTTNPGNINMWKSVSTPLPRCYSWSVNKRVPPGWTWPGGPLNWTWSVYNAGPPLPITGGPVIEDHFIAAPHAPSGLGVNSTTLSCVPASPACAGTWSPSPATTPSLATSVLKPTALDYKQELDMLLAVNPVPATLVHGDVVCNAVSATPQPIPGPNAYWKSLATLNSNACAKILNTATIAVTKVVLNHSGIPIPPATSFAITVNCTYPLDPTGVTIPSTTLTLTAGATGTVTHIPVQSLCSVSDLPQAPAPTPNCAFPAWQVYTTPLSPVAIPMSSANGTVAVTLVNDLICKPVGSIVIKKTTSFAPGGPPPFSSVSFTVNCNPLGPHTTVSVPANGQIVIPNVPIVSTCSIVEIVPANIPGCTWTTSPNPIPTVTVNVPNSTTTVKVTNKLVCTGRMIVRKKTSVPQGIALPTAINFNVNCVPGGAFTTSTPPNGLSAPLVVPAPSVCSVSEQVPLAPAGCAWNVVKSPPGTVPVAPGATVLVSFANTLVCKPGRIVIKKVTIHPVAQGPFTFLVNCPPGGPTNLSVTVPSNGSATVGNIVTPGSCTVAEQPHAAPAGCTWVGTQAPPGPVTVAPGATVTITYTNKLVCTGTLQILKQTNSPTHQAPFTFLVNCTPGGPTNLSVSVPMLGTVPINNIPAPATCTAVEQPHSAPPGCTWVATQAPPGPINIAAGAAVTISYLNNLVCNQGTLIIKKITIPSPVASAFASIPIDVDCNPTGPHSSLALPANGQVSVGGIPGASSCAVTEHFPALGASCAWVGTPSPSNPVTVPGGMTVTMTITNKVVCSPPPQSALVVVKKTIVPPGMAMPASVSFTVNCGGSNVVVAAPANGASPSVATPPAPAQCVVAEQLPPAPVGCAWNVNPPMPVSVAAVSAGTATVNVIDRLECPVAGDGTLIVRKFVMVNGSHVPVSPSTLPAAWQTSFPVSVTCGSNAPVSAALNAANNYQGSAAIPVGVACTVQETTPPFPTPNCHWATTYPQGQTATLPSIAATATITINNEQVCP